jgi:hypothetical protein
MNPTLPASTRIKIFLRQLALRVVIYLLAYFVIAFAMIGPLFWYWFEAVYMHGSIWVAKFFAPLLWLCDRVEFLSWLVNKYINWCNF